MANNLFARTHRECPTEVAIALGMPIRIIGIGKKEEVGTFGTARLRSPWTTTGNINQLRRDMNTTVTIACYWTVFPRIIKPH